MKVDDGFVGGLCRRGTMNDAGVRNSVQIPAVPGLPTGPYVINFFVAGTQVIRWELSTMPGGEVYRLAVFHAGGTIIEYFTSTTAALEREQELEALFVGTPLTIPAASS